MGKEHQHPDPIPANGPPNKQPGYNEVSEHNAIRKQPSDPPPLSIEEPECERPNTSQRVVSGDREHAGKAGRRIVCSGERERQHSARKRGPTGHHEDEDAAPKRERPKERVDPDPGPPRLAHERGTRRGQMPLLASGRCLTLWFVIPSRAEVLQPALISLVGLVFACVALAIFGTGTAFFWGQPYSALVLGSHCRAGYADGPTNRPRSPSPKLSLFDLAALLVCGVGRVLSPAGAIEQPPTDQR